MKTFKLSFSIFFIFAFQIANAQYWNLTGNSGTSPATNFIGTTDSVPFTIKAIIKELATLTLIIPKQILHSAT